MADELKPCPFCGSAEVEIINTHTPSFWVRCDDCGAEAHGEYFSSIRLRKAYFHYSPEPDDSGFEATYDDLHPEYKRAFDSAVAAWNRRPAASVSAPSGAGDSEASVEVTDEMAMAFHRAMTDADIGSAEIDEIKTGLRAALAWQASQGAAVESVDRRDAERLDFMIEQQASIVWSMRDGTIRQCQLWTGDEDENVWVISGEDRYFNMPRDAIDAAIAAQQESGNG